MKKVLPLCVYDASMGPRSIDRGIKNAVSDFVSTVKLQWGLDQLIEESNWLNLKQLIPPSFNGASIN